jgi:hypothetical protein
MGALAIASLVDAVALRLGVPLGPPLLKERILWKAMEAGHPRPYPRVSQQPSPAGLAPPMVLATAHVGSMLALGALLEQLSGEVLALHASYPARPGLAMHALAGASEAERAGAFRRALLMLRAGGFVLIAADGGGERRVPAEVLGHRVPLASGPFALARIACVPLLPVAAYWPGWTIRIAVGAPIPPAPEPEMAAAFGRWLDQELRCRPGEASPALDLVRRSPLAGGTGARPAASPPADLPA